jgi:hypothetical protein
VPVALLAGGQARWLLFAAAAAAAFLLATLPIMGIFFPLSIQCYALALLPAGEAGFLAPAPLCAVLLLCTSTALGAENWPLNAMAMFPYS